MTRLAANPCLRFRVPVIIDTREQHPYAFADLRADAKDGRRPLFVEAHHKTLTSGDYSLSGYESEVAIERKSIADLFSTLAAGRKRFERELDRLSNYTVAAVVVEAEWSEILTSPPSRSMLNPKTIFRSVIAWQLRYPRIHWWMLPGRGVAEKATFRILERFAKDKLENGERLYS